MTPIVSATILRTQSDVRLVRLVHQGYERAFEAIVERYRRPLHRYCRRMLSESRSEDAVQQTFLKAWSALQGGEEVKDLKPWLYRIARNNALDALKKAGYDYDELSESLRAAGTPAEDVERRTVMRQTLTGLAALPSRQRDVLLGLAIEGKSRAEVAADLGITDGAVRQLAHRARLAMRAAATAVTPLPLAGWAAALARDDAGVRERIAELATGGGAAGLTGALTKGGAVIVAAGVLATAPSAVNSPAQRDPSVARAAQGVNGDRNIERVFGRPASAATGSQDAQGQINATTVKPVGPARHLQRSAGSDHPTASGDDSRGPGGGRLADGGGGGDRSGSGGGDRSGSGDGGGSPEAPAGGGDHSGSSPGGGSDTAPSGGVPSDGGDRSGPGAGGALPPDSSGRDSSGSVPDLGSGH